MCPGLVGSADGLLAVIGKLPDKEFIKISIPKSHFWNRKNFYAINCQVMVDSWARIQMFDVNSPGAMHDVLAWTISYFYIKKMGILLLLLLLLLLIYFYHFL